MVSNELSEDPQTIDPILLLIFFCEYQPVQVREELMILLLIKFLMSQLLHFLLVNRKVVQWISHFVQLFLGWVHDQRAHL